MIWIKVKCSNRLGYTLINRQVGTRGCSPTQICMKGSISGNTQKLSYNAYRNPNLTDGWVGDGGMKGGYLSTTYSALGNGAVQSIPHYFNLYKAPLPTPDTYSDQYVMEIAY